MLPNGTTPALLPGSRGGAFGEGQTGHLTKRSSSFCAGVKDEHESGCGAGLLIFDDFDIISIMPSISTPPASGSAGVIRSRIVDWDASRGFGFVDHGGKRLFVHHRDFARKDHRPQKGDSVAFTVGTDGKGRACAKLVESLERRGQLRFRHLVVLFVLLIVPTLAVFWLPWSPWISLAYVGIVSLLNFRDYRHDKLLARQGRRRVPESSLHFLGLIGGWPGGYLAQRQYRHKTAKTSFQRTFWATVLLHEAVGLDFLLGWPMGRRLIAMLADLVSYLPA